ncbi:ankyrin repeat and LEM domain-containing protein 1-like [Saccostrea cucullata]|uniref:ankyrin repeat and LEM domain-containing protein 1-like n=1 Tax=Saccostrea cuccullata TaxID=36930 RepID=UPI002ED632F1
MEDELIKVFTDKSLSWTWGEGALKSSFKYLLLNPRFTQDLPNRADSLGKRSRPYCHLFEAQSHMNNNLSKADKKVQHILDIWNDGQEVVSLHCVQSVIPVEAYTREACVVDAIGATSWMVCRLFVNM